LFTNQPGKIAYPRAIGSDFSRCHSDFFLGWRNRLHATVSHIFTQNDYLEIFVVSFSEFPGVLATIGMLELIGRKKKTICLTFSISALCTLLLLFCSSEIFDRAMLFIIRASIAGAFQAIYVYAPEVYPTHIRSTGIGFCSFVARIGGILTPFVAQTLGETHLHFTLIIYGSFMILAGILSLVLPFETKGRKLGDVSVEKIDSEKENSLEPTVVKFVLTDSDTSSSSSVDDTDESSTATNELT